MKQYIKYIAFILALLSALAQDSCKVAPNVSPNDMFVASIVNPPGYYYPEAVGFVPVTSPPTDLAPVNTQAFIIFNMPMDASTVTTSNITIYSSALVRDLVGGPLNEYEISLDPSSLAVATITFHYDIDNPLMANDTLTVTVGTGVRSFDRGISLNPSVNFTFDTGAAPDIQPPLIAVGGNGPTGAGISLTSPSVHATFTEDLDPSSINTATFYLEDDLSNLVPSTVTYTAATYTAALTPLVDLDPNVQYTVTVTAGVRDVSQNYFAGTAWTFTTTTTPLDMTPGTGPALTGPIVDSVGLNVAKTFANTSISWYTDEPTNFLLLYGRGIVATANVNGSSDYASFHTVDQAYNANLGLLTTNARYWFSVTYADYENFGGGATTAARQFNTESTESVTAIDSGADEQYSPKSIQYNPLNGSATGFFIFWVDQKTTATTHDYIYGQLHDNGFNPLWNSGVRQPLYTETNGHYYFESAVEDGVGGVILIAKDGSNYAYAKRKLAAGAALEWGATAAAGQPGIPIKATTALTSVTAVPVYAGMVTRVVAPGAVAEMASLGLNNPFFDDDVNLSGLNDGDIIFDPVNHNGTTVDTNSGSGQDFVYIAGQDAAIITPPDTYATGSGTSVVTTTAEDHNIWRNHFGVYWGNWVSGSTPTTADFNTGHGYTLPGGWTLGVGDIVRNGASYGTLIGVTLETPIAVFDSGTATGGGNNNLYDFKWWTFSPQVYVDDRVINVTDSLLTYVTAVADGDLTLNTPPNMSFDAGDAYEIYARYCEDHLNDLNQFSSFYRFTSNWAMGITAATSFSIYDSLAVTGTAQAIPASPLCDNGATFTANGVTANDIVVNFTTHAAERVSSTGYQHMLGMASQIINDGNEYGIIRFNYANTDKSSILYAGIATSGTATTLGDTGVNFTTLPTPVQPGDVAYNYTSGTLMAVITAVAANTLTLSRDASFAAGSRYVIIRRLGVLYVWNEGTNVLGRMLSMEGTPPVQTYPEFTVITGGQNPRAISDASGNAIVVYRTTAATPQIWAVKLTGLGSTTQWSIEIDTQVASAESLIDVQTDTAGGVVILYKYNNDLYAQRISSAGARVWGGGGVSFDGDGVTTVTSNDIMRYVPSVDEVVGAATIVAATSDVVAWRRSFATPANNWSRTIGVAGSNQMNPQLYVNGTTNVVICWDDNRFFGFAGNYIDTGYGIFGLKVNYAGGTPLAAWDADTGAATDYNGASIVLNHYNEAPGSPLAVPYNNGANAVLLWEDFRAGQGGDLLYRNLDGFTPP